MNAFINWVIPAGLVNRFRGLTVLELLFLGGIFFTLGKINKSEKSIQKIKSKTEP